LGDINANDVVIVTIAAIDDMAPASTTSRRVNPTTADDLLIGVDDD
jgi:hypothetical protein